LSKYRRAAKVDDNQAQIVQELRTVLGVTVQTDHDDILVGYDGKTHQVEIKNPARCLNKDGSLKVGALQPSQKKLIAEWTGSYFVAWDSRMILIKIGAV
jgi:exopolysaccharide biosynthesis protein